MPLRQSDFDKTYRYRVTVTPLNCCSIPYAAYNQNDGMYDGVHVCFMTDKSFGFIPGGASIGGDDEENPLHTAYSYFVRGYTH